MKLTAPTDLVLPKDETLEIMKKLELAFREYPHLKHYNSPNKYTKVIMISGEYSDVNITAVCKEYRKMGWNEVYGVRLAGETQFTFYYKKDDKKGD